MRGLLEPFEEEGRVGEGLHRVGVAHVGHQRQRPPAQHLDLLGDAFYTFEHSK